MLYTQTEALQRIYLLIHAQLGLLQLIEGCRERAATLGERVRGIPSAVEGRDKLSNELTEAQINIELMRNDLISKIRSGNAATAESLAKTSKEFADLAILLSAHFEPWSSLKVGTG